MGKGSTRRKCLTSREEETLRWDLALGKITLKQYEDGMDKLEYKVNSTGYCFKCKDGLMVGQDYDIVCRKDTTVHSRYDTCSKFREDK